MNEYTVRFLDAFFALYDAYIVKIYEQNNFVNGVVSYTDESGTQEFKWQVPQSALWQDAIFILNVISANNFSRGDKINVSSKELVDIINDSNWTKQRIDSTMQFLFSISIPMIDDGESGDSFFIHP